MDKRIPDKYERVTKRINGNVAVKTYTGSYALPLDVDEIQAIERLAIFEDLLEEGKLVQLPCKVDDDIYFVWDYEGKAIVDVGKVTGISHQREGIWISARYDSGLSYWHLYSEIGKSVFFDRDQATAAERRLNNEKST